MVLIVGVLTLIGMGFMHEVAHQEIFRSYGIDSKIGVNFLSKGDIPSLSLYTMPEEPCPNDACILAHNNNESSSYHLLPFAAFMVMVSAIVCAELTDYERRY